MVKGYNYIGAGLEKLLICLTILICIWFFIGLSEASQTSQTGLRPGRHSDLSEDLVQNYKEQISLIQSEIKKIQLNMEWLSMKIKKSKDFGRPVSQQLYDSIEFKASKIKALEKLKDRYEHYVKSAITSHPTKKATKKIKSGLNSGLENNIKKRIIALGLEDWVELYLDCSPLRLENRLPILFASGGITIAKGYESFLQKLATLVKGYDVRIIVNGYADTDPIHTNEYPSNFELGAARAAAIVHSLVKYGIKPSIFSIGSTGEYSFNSHKTSEMKNLQRHINITVFFTARL